MKTEKIKIALLMSSLFLLIASMLVLNFILSWPPSYGTYRKEKFFVYPESDGTSRNRNSGWQPSQAKNVHRLFFIRFSPGSWVASRIFFIPEYPLHHRQLCWVYWKRAAPGIPLPRQDRASVQHRQHSKILTTIFSCFPFR